MRQRQLRALSRAGAGGPAIAAPPGQLLAPENDAPACWREPRQAHGLRVERLQATARRTGQDRLRVSDFKAPAQPLLHDTLHLAFPKRLQARFDTALAEVTRA